MHLENVQCQLKKKKTTNKQAKLLPSSCLRQWLTHSCLNRNLDPPKQLLTLHLLTVVQDQCEMSLVFSMFSIVCTVLCNGKWLQVLKEKQTYSKTAIITTVKQRSTWGRAQGDSQ